MNDLTLSDHFNNLLNCCDNLGEALEPFDRLYFVKESESLVLLFFKDASYTFVFKSPKEKENIINYFSGENLFDRDEFLGRILPFLKEYPKFIKEMKDILEQFAQEFEK